VASRRHECYWGSPGWLVKVGDGVQLDPATVAAAAFTFPAHLGSLGMKRKRCPNILLANIYRCPIESGTPTLW
jgi:hypothetical protein